MTMQIQGFCSEHGKVSFNWAGSGIFSCPMCGADASRYSTQVICEKCDKEKANEEYHELKYAVTICRHCGFDGTNKEGKK